MDYFNDVLTTFQGFDYCISGPLYCILAATLMFYTYVYTTSATYFVPFALLSLGSLLNKTMYWSALH